MKAHPAADVFPMLDQASLRALADDIKEHGLRYPIVTHDDLILDGRNRWAACKMVKVEPRTLVWKGTDPIAYVVSANIHRRHLDESQRAMVGARIKHLYEADAQFRMKAGVRANLPAGRAREQAATAVNVSPRSVQTAAKVIAEGTAELVRAVDMGIVPVSHAARLASRPADEQREVVKRVEAGEAKNAIQAERAVEQAKRAALPARAESSIIFQHGDARELVRKMKERPHLVVTDPPYGIETHNTRRGGKDYQDGDGSFDLMSDVFSSLAGRLAPDAHLYVFAGYDGVDRVKRLLAEWFDVQPNPLIWIKENHTMCDFSQWYPNKHEYIIFAKAQGSKRRLAACVPDTIECARSRVTTHSAEKPVALLETLIGQSSMPGELVLDPFAGGGSTGVAARHLKRQFLGFELEKEWFDVARTRAD